MYTTIDHTQLTIEMCEFMILKYQVKINVNT